MASAAGGSRSDAVRVAHYVEDRLMTLTRHMQLQTEDFLDYSKVCAARSQIDLSGFSVAMLSLHCLRAQVLRELGWDRDPPAMLEHLRRALQQPGRKVILEVNEKFRFCFDELAAYPQPHFRHYRVRCCRIGPPTMYVTVPSC